MGSPSLFAIHMLRIFEKVNRVGAILPWGKYSKHGDYNRVLEKASSLFKNVVQLPSPNKHQTMINKCCSETAFMWWNIISDKQVIITNSIRNTSKRWLEFIKFYNLNLFSQEGKDRGNVVRLFFFAFALNNKKWPEAKQYIPLANRIVKLTLPNAFFLLLWMVYWSFLFLSILKSLL